MNPVSHGIYLYELWTGLYMLDPVEKAAFNTVVLTATGLTCYYAYSYLSPLLA